MIINYWAQIAKDSTQIFSEYLTRKEVIDLFDKIQSFHSNEYVKFLAELSILLAVLGSFAVFITIRRIATTVASLNRDSERSENRLNRAMDNIREDNRHFQESINERLEENLSKKVEELQKIIDTQISNAEHLLDNHIKVSHEVSVLITYMFELRNSNENDKNIERSIHIFYLALDSLNEIISIDKLAYTELSSELENFFSTFDDIVKSYFDDKNVILSYKTSCKTQEMLIHLEKIIMDIPNYDEKIRTLIQTLNKILSENNERFKQKISEKKGPN